MKGSIVIAVLQSYEVVRRQLLWFDKLLLRYPSWELVMVDDGSVPEIPNTSTSDRVRFIRVPPHDEPWTQPRARNIGAASCVNSDYVFFTDIDHVITEEAMDEADKFTGDKLHFLRKRGALNIHGVEVLEREKLLLEYGGREDTVDIIDTHYNTFCIRRFIHVCLLHGYDEKFCGKYGGDDTDYSSRYGELHYSGIVNRSVAVNACVLVFPDPKADRKHFFHDLRAKGHTAWN